MFINGSMGKLNAILQLPELAENEKCPMVILSHGFTGSLDFPLWEPIAQNMNASGIGVLRFDFNGHGKSEGEFQNMTVPSEIDDLMNVISWVRSQKETQSVSLVGHSQGGVVSAMAAGRLGSEQIANLALISAAAILRVQALQGNIWGATFDPWQLDKPWYQMADGGKLGREYIQTAMDLPIYIIGNVRRLYPDLAICVKVNCEDFMPGGLSADDSIRTSMLALEAGADVIDISGNNASRTKIKTEEQEAYFADCAKRLAEKTGKPVILTGGIRSMAKIQELQFVIGNFRAYCFAVINYHFPAPAQNHYIASAYL